MESAAIIPAEQPANILSIPRSFFLLTDEQFKRIQFMAKMYAASSFNAGDDKKTEGDYFIIMIKGMELGMSLTAAVEFISVIKGKPCIDGKGMLALIRNNPKCGGIEIDSQDESCTVTGRRADTGDTHSETWTLDDARKFLVWEKGSLKPLADRQQWRSQPKTMLKWRAVAAFARALFSDVIGGLYSKEEMLEGEVVVTDNGEMNAAPVLPATKSPAPLPEKATQPVSLQPGKWVYECLDDGTCLDDFKALCKELGIMATADHLPYLAALGKQFGNGQPLERYSQCEAKYWELEHAMRDIHQRINTPGVAIVLDDEPELPDPIEDDIVLPTAADLIALSPVTEAPKEIPHIPTDDALKLLNGNHGRKELPALDIPKKASEPAITDPEAVKLVTGGKSPFAVTPDKDAEKALADLEQ